MLFTHGQSMHLPPLIYQLSIAYSHGLLIVTFVGMLYFASKPRILCVRILCVWSLCVWILCIRILCIGFSVSGGIAHNSLITSESGVEAQ